jgi:RNA polymerase sigma factor (TIGR02999 family)
MPRTQSSAAARYGDVPSESFTASKAFLTQMAGGDGQKAEVLFLSVYAELRELAETYYRRKRKDDTLQPTALVHEVYLRLARSELAFQSRSHFLATAATAMRQILIDRERRRRSLKRGGDATRVTVTGEIVRPARDAREAVVDVLALDAALTRLAALSERQARIVELLSFGGFTVDEAAETLDVSVSLAEKEWRRARAWLRRELSTSE